MQNIECLGKYKIIEEIGRGGFGIVYKAEDTTLERIVALKVLSPQFCGDLSFIQRFHREAKAIARLRHSHIVTVYEIGVEDGQVYMAMEYIPGKTLTKLLEDDGSLSPAQMVCILEQLAGALDYAHSQGLLHRDINPNNIMVEIDNRNHIQATLMDFGLVKIIEGSQYVRSTRAVMGTPEYMSPEQANGQELDSRSDLYALGVVAYQMCTGKVPFHNSSPLVVMRFHMDEEPPRPRVLNPELPEKVDPVLLKALHKQPSGRYQRAEDLVMAFTYAFDLVPEVKPLPHVIILCKPFEPDLVLIPAGEFLMGSNLEYKYDRDGYNEKPQHLVYLPDYYIAKTPVTNAQYLAFVKATGYKAPKHWKSGPISWIRGQIPFGKECHPVIDIRWHDAVAYCRWLAEVTGKPYRLPTEAEWEKAARGTDGRIYPWGNEWHLEWCNINESEFNDTTPVGKYSPYGDSPYGCVDMAGNVWEWTGSLLKDYPYCVNDGREDMNTESRRVLRGGSFYDYGGITRCSYRDNYQFLRSIIGFRVAVTISF